MVIKTSHTPINWQRLREPRDSSFEELCCQLAAYESVPADAVFVRKGPPDAGVECFWKLPNGNELGWQAKFFLAPPSQSRWQQIDDSVRQALKKHPRLTTYTICLPIDRQDPRVKRQSSFMDKWNRHVIKWRSWARKQRRRPVKYQYWGNFEISERLSLSIHRGRSWYWFDEQFFGLEWFRNRVDVAIANVGVRYTPELSVRHPISRKFHALGRTSQFYTSIVSQYGKMKLDHSKAQNSPPKGLAKQEFQYLQKSMTELLSILGSI
jgi:hypothetical protein